MKKFIKFFLTMVSFVALIGGAFYFIKNVFMKDSMDDFDDDFDDDEDDEFDDDDEREYVTLNVPDESASEETETVTDEAKSEE